VEMDTIVHYNYCWVQSREGSCSKESGYEGHCSIKCKPVPEDCLSDFLFHAGRKTILKIRIDEKPLPIKSICG
jgi:hypothetical protein